MQDASEAHPGTVGKLRSTAFQRCPDELERRLARQLWSLEMDGGTGGIQYLSTFAILSQVALAAADRMRGFFFVATSGGQSSVRKTTRAFIRAPLESPHPQLSNGARMSVWVVLHAEF